MQSKTTNELLKLLNNTHSPIQLEEYRTKYTLDSSALTFSHAFSELLEVHQLSKASVIKDSLLDRTYAYQIINGSKKPGRDKIIALGIAARFSLKEIQHLLMCSSEGSLYSRSSRDAILIYVIEHELGVLSANEMLFDSGEALLE